MSHLLSKKCAPCNGDTPPLDNATIHKLLADVPEWDVIDDENTKIGRTFTFKDFVEAMNFVNKVADLAEAEGHHPDIIIHYNKVTLELWTHAIGGLSENDFIVAAKADAL